VQDIETLVKTLSGIDLFKDVSQDQRQRLEKKCHWQTFSKNQVIFEKASEGDAVYFVVSGGAWAVNNATDGPEIICAEIEVGRFFGELSCVGDGDRSARVIAREDTLVAVFQHVDFISALKESPDLAIKMIELLSSIIRQSNERLTEVADLSPDQRVYAELIRLANPSTGEDNSWVIDPLPLHSEISGRAGTKSEDVSLAFGTLIREGVARRRDSSLIIKDFSKLQMLRNQ
jgi:CRP/FNR family cyclic AMP-dependent transcriptional regulator